jgi:hypothetical protein
VNTKRTPESRALSALIVSLRDEHGLSWAQIVARLACDLGITRTRTAVWVRYQREKQS